MKILFYGDSITDMGRSREDWNNDRPYGLGMGYAYLVSADLVKENPSEYSFVNSGISGNILLYVKLLLQDVFYATS